MCENSLDTFFDKLVEVLILDLALYIPSDLIPTGVLEELEGSIPDHYFNELTILDPLGFGEFEIEEFNERLIKKKTQLEKNIFKLLESKTVLKEFEFVYILDKYFKQLEFYVAITNWLRVNLKNYNQEKINLTTVGSFEIQFEIYKSHFNEFLQHFQTDFKFTIKDEFPISELLKNYFPEMIARYQLTSSNEKGIEALKNSSTKNESSELTPKIELEHCKKLETNSEPKKKKQKLTVNDNEIELFLLESVFNIPIAE